MLLERGSVRSHPLHTHLLFLSTEHQFFLRHLEPAPTCPDCSCIKAVNSCQHDPNSKSIAVTVSYEDCKGAADTAAACCPNGKCPSIVTLLMVPADPTPSTPEPTEAPTAAPTLAPTKKSKKAKGKTRGGKGNTGGKVRRNLFPADESTVGSGTCSVSLNFTNLDLSPDCCPVDGEQLCGNCSGNGTRKQPVCCPVSDCYPILKSPLNPENPNTPGLAEKDSRWDVFDECTNDFGSCHKERLDLNLIPFI